jgi:hypothetical protein
MPSPNDAAVLGAYGEAVEAAKRECEAKWGLGRLERLVALGNTDLLARFRRQQQTWAAAIAAAWGCEVIPAGVLASAQVRAEAMQRAWWALNAWAEAEGHRPIAPWVWEVRLADGTVAALVEDDAAASKVIAEGRAVAVYTAQEVGALIDAIPGALQLAKATWQGAKFKAPDVPRSNGQWVAVGDEIPFGDAPPGGLTQPDLGASSNASMASAALPTWQEDLAP